MIRHGDGLDQADAVRFEPPAADPEEGRQVAVADRLDHLDGDQPVELTAQVPVILAASRVIRPVSPASRIRWSASSNC